MVLFGETAAGERVRYDRCRTITKVGLLANRAMTRNFIPTGGKCEAQSASVLIKCTPSCSVSMGHWSSLAPVLTLNKNVNPADIFRSKRQESDR